MSKEAYFSFYINSLTDLDRSDGQFFKAMEW